MAASLAAACGPIPPLLPPTEIGCVDEAAPPCTAFPCVVQTAVVVPATAQVPVRLVLVPEGYTEEDLPLWREDAERITEDILWGAVASVAPGLFQIERVDLPSPTRDVARGPRGDTLLGACLQSDPLDGDGGWVLHDGRLVLLASALAPADALIVVIQGAGGGAHAGGESSRHQVLQEAPRIVSATRVAPPVVVIERDAWPNTVSHELGHALVGLGDEYSDTERCFEDTRLPFRTMLDLPEPNLSLDPSGTRWLGLADGSRPGGARHAGCIFHPTNRCLMLDSSRTSAFCPVCADATARWLDERLVDTLPPTCTFEMSADPLALMLAEQPPRVRVLVADDRPGVYARLELDGEPLLFARGDDVTSLVDELALPLDRVGAAGSVLTLACSDGAANGTTSRWPLRR